jgi:hypothetical protein
MCVGIAYFVIAVLVPLVLLARGERGGWTSRGVLWSMLAGTAVYVNAGTELARIDSLRGLLSPAEVVRLKRGIDINLSQPSPRSIVASRPDDPGFFIEDFCNWQRIEQFRQVAFESRAADVAGALMGSREVRLFHDHMLVKEPGTPSPTPWHNDTSYWHTRGSQICSIWIALDDATISNGCLWYLPGTHKLARWDNAGIGENIGSLFKIYPEWRKIAAVPAPMRVVFSQGVGSCLMCLPSVSDDPAQTH